jgi:ech hydrogenase subunit A
MVLMLFHAFSKALLFLAAGVLEKRHHAKESEEMKGMVSRAPATVGYIMFGFMSLTLPPFGLFMGKLFAITSVASLLRERPELLVVLLGLIIGSALLVLLYFKVASALLSNPSDTVRSEKEHIPYGYHVPLILLSVFIVVAAAGLIAIQRDIVLGIFVFPLLFVLVLPSIMRGMGLYDRTKTYHCGEKEVFDAALVYYAPSVKIKQAIYWGFGVLFIGLALAGALS